MPFVTLVETSENNRGRFISSTMDEALAELGRHYPVGASVADRLKKGERVVTDSYTLAVVALESGPAKKQRLLF
jgi:hypothetical protein